MNCACGCGQQTNARFVPKYGRFVDPKYVHNHHRRGAKQSEETRAKMSAYALNRSDQHNQRLSDAVGNRDSKDFATAGRVWKGRKHTTEAKLKQSVAKKRNWEDPNYREDQARAIIQGSTNMPRPNLVEQKLARFLDSRYPGDWKYVGDGSVILGRKNPDFINVNGRKLIIEMFGDYWHQGHDPEDRAKAFEPFGFRTLVIWQSEMNNLLHVGAKVREFING